MNESDDSLDEFITRKSIKVHHGSSVSSLTKSSSIHDRRPAVSPNVTSGRVSLKRPSNRSESAFLSLGAISPSDDATPSSSSSSVVLSNSLPKVLSSSVSTLPSDVWRNADTDSSSFSCELSSHPSLCLFSSRSLCQGRVAIVAIEGGSMWQMSLPLHHHTELLLRDAGEIIVWDAKESLCRMQTTACEWTLRDCKVALWLLDPEDENQLTWENAAKKWGDPTSTPLLAGGWMGSLNVVWKMWGNVKAALMEKQLWNVFIEQEMRLVPCLARMELAGMIIQHEQLHQHTKAIKAKMDMLQQDAQRLLKMKDINLGSAQQMAHVMFDQLKISPPSGARTKGGSRLALTKEILEELRCVHPIAGMVLQFRTLQKLSSVWLDGLAACIVRSADRMRDGEVRPRILAEWMQTATATGRLSSLNPNVQNLPHTPISLCLPKAPENVHDEEPEMHDVSICVRGFFIARPNHVLVAADYAQMEMRILASLSHDRRLLSYFRDNLDIHTEVAAHWKRKPSSQVTSEEREIAKRVVYALMYGMGPGRLSKVLKVSPQSARQFLDSFLSSFPDVQQFMDRTVRQARANGFVTTVAGRRRLLPDIRNAESGDASVRQAVNTVIQGSAADFLKRALVELHRRIEQKTLPCVLVCTVHDEIIVEVEQSQAQHVAKELVHIMMQAAPSMEVPLVATAMCGASLGDLAPITWHDP